MAMHMVAYYELLDPAGALVPIAAVNDETVYSVGDDIRVPEGMANVIGAAAVVNDVSVTRAQLQSPSLRALANLDVEPIVTGNAFGSPPEGNFHPASPNPLSANESLNMYMQSDPTAAVNHFGIVVLADGPQQPVQGNIITVSATAPSPSTTAIWLNEELTFNQTLPVGNYQVVGMRARGAGVVAARLNFKGGVWRPGVFGVNDISDLDVKTFRYGRAGIFGQFHTNTPPSIDVLAVSSGAVTVILDLIRA